MQQYHELIEYILQNGVQKEDRTGVGTISVFSPPETRYNLDEGFPILTTKKIYPKNVIAELLWFLEGSTDERRLAELTYGKPREELKDKTTIWTANSEEQGKKLGYHQSDSYRGLGPIYSHQWRKCKSSDGEVIDQIKEVIKLIKNDPNSRRIIINAWNVGDLKKMALPPCHTMSQFYVQDGKLSCKLTQRSADTMCGVGYNIISYALLTHILARECSIGVGEFVHSIGDAHIYLNHTEGAREQLTREPYPLPTLKIHPDFNLQDGLDNGFPIDAVKYFTLENYQHHPFIKFDMAV